MSASDPSADIGHEADLIIPLSIEKIFVSRVRKESGKWATLQPGWRGLKPLGEGECDGAISLK